MTVKSKIYSEYKKELSEITNNLSLKEGMQSGRTGTKKIRDYIVFFKMAWTESLSYFAIIQTAIIFTALVPNAISNINTVLKSIGAPYEFPIGLSSMLSVVMVGMVLLFGYISYRYFGIARRSYEVIALYNPVNILLYEKLKNIESELEGMKDERD